MRFALCAAYFTWMLAMQAADWPQWRGPKRNSISSETIATNWPSSGPKVLWRASVGTGFSSISIRYKSFLAPSLSSRGGDAVPASPSASKAIEFREGRVCTMGNTGEQDTIWCFDALTGKVLWKHTYSAPLGSVYYEGGPGSTPTIYSNRVYTISKWGQVFCLELTNGAVRWQRDLRQEGITPNRWGFAGSPLIGGNGMPAKLILNAGGAGTALDVNSGKTIWSNGTNATGYASPTRFMGNGNESVLIFAAKHLVAVEADTGKELWRYPWQTGWDTNNPDPLIYGDSIFISTFDRGCALLSVKEGKPVTVYDNQVLHNNLSPGVIVGDYLYSASGEAKKETDFRCIHLPTGELKWAQKDLPTASVICAGGKLLILTEKGELVLAEAAPEGFKPLARAQVLGGVCWTPPALANGLVYVRNARGDLVCLDLRATGE
jgi:outer membrane protein assembly factor BamB